jgi:hypothetical protein
LGGEYLKRLHKQHRDAHTTYIHTYGHFGLFRSLASSTKKKGRFRSRRSFARRRRAHSGEVLFEAFAFHSIIIESEREREKEAQSAECKLSTKSRVAAAQQPKWRNTDAKDGTLSGKLRCTHTHSLGRSLCLTHSVVLQNVAQATKVSSANFCSDYFAERMTLREFAAKF